MGTAAANAGQQLSWLWNRESLLRLALALTLAVGLWLYVTHKQDPGTIDFGQPIAVSTSNLDPAVTLTNTLPSVHVRYRTDNPNVFVTPGSFRASVNLQRKGKGTYDRVKVQVTSDPGITVVNVSPAFIPVVLDLVLTKRVPVVARYQVRTPPAGYEAGTPKIVPSVVQVSGPASIASQVTQVSVEIDLSGAGSTIIEDARPTPENSQGIPVNGAGSLSIDPLTVRVNVPITAVAGYKTLPVLVPVVGHPRAGYGVAGITVDPPAITASGPPKPLAHLSTVSTSPVNVSGHSGGTLRRRLKVLLPKGVSPIGTLRVTVIILLKPVEASSSTEIGVVPENVAPGLVAHIRPADVLVTFVGPTSALRRAAHGLAAVVDLNGLGLGIYQLVPRVTAPRGLLVQHVNPVQVGVVVQLAPTR